MYMYEFNLEIEPFGNFGKKLTLEIFVDKFLTLASDHHPLYATCRTCKSESEWNKDFTDTNPAVNQYINQ